MSYKRVIWIFNLFVVFGCIETIQLDLPEQSLERLVIEGFVERGKDYLFKITVTQTESLNEIFLIIQVPAEIVLVVDDQPTIPLVNGQLQRIPVDQFHQIYGGTPETATFKLRAWVNENLYESSNESILDVPTGASLDITLTERSILNERDNIVSKEFIELSISTSLLNSVSNKTSLIWHISGAYSFSERAWANDPFWFPKTCYITDQIMANNIIVLNAQEASGNAISEFMIHEQEANHRYNEDYYYTVIQKSLTQKAVKYWQQTAASLTHSGTIFNNQSGRVIGNIRNVDDPEEEVLGYFSASAVDTVRLLTTYEETGEQGHLCSKYENPSDFPPCCNCLELRNSTDKKPHYWK
ncbi:MAG: DUF4249 domain-containing protein [Saprospiraceae bacterium]|nr:DUF4249 domain-containing protein [Saprospiraceae bacterium]